MEIIDLVIQRFKRFGGILAFGNAALENFVVRVCQSLGDWPVI